MGLLPIRLTGTFNQRSLPDVPFVVRHRLPANKDPPERPGNINRISNRKAPKRLLKSEPEDEGFDDEQSGASRIGANILGRSGLY